MNEEGPLSDRQAQNEQRKVDATVRRMAHSDLETLEKMPEFRRYMGRLFQRCGLTDDLDTTNGGEIQRFLGRRSVAVELVQELEAVNPKFYLSVLMAREEIADMLRKAAQPKQEEA